MNQNETQNIIKGIIGQMPLQVDEISFSCEDDSQTLWCQVTSKESNLFIGRDGETLSALNHLARKLVERYYFDKNPDSPRTENKIVIDVNGFQKNKIENLKTLAHTLAEREGCSRIGDEVEGIGGSVDLPD
jgi:predicted RNA-binding protein Jag